MNAASAFVLSASLALAALLAHPASAEVSAKKVAEAKQVTELAALGARKLTAAEFRKSVVGKRMTAKGWWWIIDKDGTTSSEATDGSWKEVRQPWNMKGDSYCTKFDGEGMKCRDVYMVGSFMRMSDRNNPKLLSSWTVALK